MKPMPISSIALSTTAGSAISFMPSPESTSAAPDFEEMLLFPCLATGTPAAATTIAAAVEIFSVPLPSPPVPTISVAPSGALTGLHLDRMTLAAAAYSVTVSPLVRRAARNPPICASVALPSMMVANAASASSLSSGRSQAIATNVFKSPICAPPRYPERLAIPHVRIPKRCSPGEIARRESGVPCDAGPLLFRLRSTP